MRIAHRPEDGPRANGANLGIRDPQVDVIHDG
jgi:hypothetical protein